MEHFTEEDTGRTRKDTRLFIHKDDPRVTLFIKLNDPSKIVAEPNFPQLNNPKKVLKYLEDTLDFLDEFYSQQSEPKKPFYLNLQGQTEEQILNATYDDFKETFTNPMSRHRFIIGESLTRGDYDRNIIQAYNFGSKLTYRDYQELFHNETLLKVSPEEISEILLKEPRTALLYLYYGKGAEKYIYPQSRRPKTPMKLLTGLQQKFSQKSNKRENHLTLFRTEPVELYTDDVKLFVPITRYGAGMSRGQFEQSGDPNQKWCGTFFYYEPDSNFFLSVSKDKLAVYDNKYAAVLDFIKRNMAGSPLSSFEVSENYTLDDIQRIMGKVRRNLAKYLMIAINEESKIKSGVITNDKEMQTIVDNFMTGKDVGLGPDGRPLLSFTNDFLSRTYKYVPYLSKFYAVEDPLDQILCYLGQKNNIDVFILTKMVGHTRVISEVLDTRDRIASFSAIYEVQD